MFFSHIDNMYDVVDRIVHLGPLVGAKETLVLNPEIPVGLESPLLLYDLSQKHAYRDRRAERTIMSSLIG